MKKRTVSGIMLSVFLLGMLALAFGISGAYLESETVLNVCPSSVQVSVHTDFTVDITVADVIDLFAFGCYLSYNGIVLDVLDVLIQPPFEGPIEIGETESYVYVSASLPPDYPKITGSLVLFSIVFRAASPGNSLLDLYDTLLIDSEILPIPHTTIDGFVLVDARKLLLETDKDTYILGENITIVLTNIGTETVQIGGYPAWQMYTYPEEEPVYPEIYAWLAWSLSPGENDTFTWNQYNAYTKSPAKPGMYVIKDTQGWGLSTYFRIIAAEKVVPDDYPTIQEAINHADAGDTIYVCNGTYYEHVIINKTISLIGEDRSTTIVDGSRNGTVISVIADYVNISGLTIQNGYHVPHVTYGIKVGEWKHGCNNVSVEGNIISDNDMGIFVYYSSNCIVFDNLVFNNCRGIDVVLSNDNHIEGNSLFNNEDGVAIGSDANNNTVRNNEIFNNDFGIQVGWSVGNDIIGNTMSLNVQAGIRFDSSNNNSIIGNTITSSDRDGIVLFGSNSNIIIANELIQNKWDGIAVWYSNANIIYHNNFLNNTKQAGSYSGSINIWDDGYPSGGNYWSDSYGGDLYSGPFQNETGSDGIGDTPYIIDENNQDRYPLMEPEDRWAPYVPNPEEVKLAFWMVNEIVYVNVTVTFSDPCFNVTSWGTITKTDYNIWVDTEIWRWTGGCILVLPPPVSHTYELGPLEDGTYRFIFQSWGIPVESIVFSIPPRHEIYITGIKPSVGPPGTEVCIWGGGATPEGVVVALFSGPLLEIPAVRPLLNITVGWTVADEDGYWNIQFIVPSLSTGKYLVYVVDDVTQASASTSFYVTVLIEIPFQINYVSPEFGPVGTSVYVSGSGASPYGEVMVFFDETNVVNTTAKDRDWWSASFEVPNFEPGNYTIMALDVMTNAMDTAMFIVTPPPTIHVSSSEASIGSKITITGEGFKPDQGVYITFEDLLFFCPVTTDENGDFRVTLFVPMVNSGNYVIKAKTMYPYQAVADVSFTVTLGVDNLFSESSSGYHSLLNDYNHLKSTLEDLTNDLGIYGNLSYIFVATTIIFITTTAYLAIRKPKAKSEIGTK